MPQEILFPVGRMVGGDLYHAREQTDAKGNKVIGEDGKPKSSYSFGVAYEKKGTTHFAQTEWGAKFWAEGHGAFPNGEAQRADFSWKVTDGDSMIPNKRGNKPAENEGYRGCWVVWFSGTYRPKTCNADGSVTYSDDVERIKPGHYVQVYGSIRDNKPSQSPGIYVNYGMTAHTAYGPEIATGGVDAKAVGFGGQPLPPGASAVPLGAMTQAQAAAGAPAVPGVPAVPGAVHSSTVPAAPIAATPNPPAAVPVTPNTAFMQPAVPGMPAVPAAVPVAPVARQMTAKAGGATYEQFAANGWTDERMRAEGYMV